MRVFRIEDGVQVTAGTEHTCARTASGFVYCWGQNLTGRLGSGDPSLSPVPVEVVNVSDATQVAAGAGHTCAVQSEGELWCWGRNNYGQLGTDGGGDRLVARRVQVLQRGRSATAWMFHSCAVRTDGIPYCWGYNRYRQLGTVSSEDSDIPAQVSGVPRATAIDAGWTHACALASTGLISCWGGAFGAEPQLLCDEEFEIELCGCTNGIDDDGDGLVDCLDDECATDRPCLGLECVPPTNFLPEFFSQSYFAVPLTQNNFEAGSCGGDGVPEIISVFRPPSDAGYTIRVNTGSASNIWGRRERCDGVEAACGSGFGGVSLVATAGETLVIGVEGAGSDGAEILLQPSEADCSDGLDNDLDGRVDCEDNECAFDPDC